MAAKRLTRRQLKPVAAQGVVGLFTGLTPTKNVAVLRRQSGLIQPAVVAPDATRIIELTNRLITDPKTRDRALRINDALGDNFALGMKIGKECGAEMGVTPEQDPEGLLTCAERKLGLTRAPGTSGAPGSDDKARTATLYLGAGIAVGLAIMLIGRRRR